MIVDDDDAALSAAQAVLATRMSVLAQQASLMHECYRRGDTHAAERLALDIHSEVSSVRYALLDELHINWKKRKR